MTTKYPRLVGYVQPKTKARVYELAKAAGKPIGHILDEAVEQLAVDRKDWIVQQAGYQTMLTVALLSALAREQLGVERVAQVRDLAAKAALQVFGPLGERPFEVSAGMPSDERLLALFDTFNE